MNDFMDCWRSDTSYIEAHTSGSTGLPKRIKLLKADMRVSAEATNDFFGITRDSVLAIPLSADYIAGKMMAVRAEIAGCRLMELPVSNIVRIDSQVDLIAIVPSQVAGLLADKDISSKVKNILVGGGPLSVAQYEALYESGIPSYLGYGMTETCSHVALRRIGYDRYYNAMSGVEFDIDSRGCLIIDSDKYSWKRMVTNDVAEVLSSTSFEWLGRYDNVVISGGLKLHPEMIESEIKRVIPDIHDFYIVGEPDEKWGSRLVMIVENPADSLARDLDNSGIDRRKLPKRIIGVKELPKGANGKLRRILPKTEGS